MDGIDLPRLEPRLQRRCLQLVQEHMKSAHRNAAGPALLPGENQSFSATQATWRFLSNPNLSRLELVEPLRPPALLDGYIILLLMTDLLESPDIGQLKQMDANALPFRLV